MSRRDATVAMLAVGLLALYVGLSDRILTFLRPQMRPYLVLSGGVLAAVSAAALLLDRRPAAAGHPAADHEHAGPDHAGHEHGHRGSRVGWLLLVPMLVAVVVAPGTLGAWAADRQRGVMFAGTYDFDLDPYLQAHAIAGTEPELRMLDFTTAAADAEDRATLAEVSVQLTGFVNRSDDGVVHLDRFVVGCCVADAALLEVVLAGDVPSDLAAEQWVRATVRLDPARSPAPDAIRRGAVPTVTVERIEAIDAPGEPYEYLYG